MNLFVLQKDCSPRAKQHVVPQQLKGGIIKVEIKGDIAVIYRTHSLARKVFSSVAEYLITL